MRLVEGAEASQRVGSRSGKRFGDRPPIAWSFGMSKKLVVVGGGAGGPSAAAKAKRLDPDLEVSVLEAGEHVSFST
jgi:hypothetical protein